MSSILDKLGFGPKRVLTKLDDGNYQLTVTPPSVISRESASIILNESQVKRYERWLTSGELIQDVFPELSASQREIIMTGLSDEAFHKATHEPDE